ncbi:MAG TPA: alpha/beta fold hydrolase [Gemmataceae bacterium]|nr:alpha/beta fold hydrolase [Gemmataceae bacterium]
MNVLWRRLLVAVCLALTLRGGLARGDEKPQPPAASPAISPIQLVTKTGTLDGGIDLPTGPGPWPVVVMIAGSGPTDRDGKQPNLKNDSLKMLGQALAARGVAVVRYDRRGIGKSAEAWHKPEEEWRIAVPVADAAEWIELLRKDRRFTRVGVVGHSEGALVGLLAAKRARADAYVSLAGAGRPAAVVLRKQLAKNVPPALREQGDAIIDELVAGRTVPNPPKALAAAFRPSVQPYLIDYFKYDPAKELAGLTVPALIVQGTADIQETVGDAKWLAAAKKGAQLRLIEGMGHTLKPAGNWLAQQRAYLDPAVPLAPGLADDAASFLKKALARDR